MLDVELLAQVYVELLGGKQPGLELTAKGTVASGGTFVRKPAPPRPKPLEARLSAEDIARHEALIQALGQNAIWKN
jgi:DNA polymerase-3 subunit epsilon